MTEEQTARSPRVADRSLSAANGCDWSTKVSDGRRCQSMQRLVCQQTQLELDALWDGKPLKAVPQHVLPASWRRRLIVLLCSSQTAVMDGLSLTVSEILRM